MGNCVSAHSSTLEIQAPKFIRVVQAAQGRVVDVEVQQSPAAMIMKVGELMLEFPPAHFLADFLASSTGKRASPLGADADATPGAVYVLFPMARLHTRISPQELLSFSKLLQLHDQKRLLAACKAAAPKVQVNGLFTAGARVAPLSEEVDNLLQYSSATNYEQECPLQQNEQGSMYSYPDSSSLSITARSCHGQMQQNKPKPWAPKLQTIQES